RVKAATVLIIAGNSNGNISSGSGFFVKPDKIVTNIHVVDSAKMVFVVGRKKVYNVEGVTGYTPEHDLVVLQVSGKGKPLELNEGQIGEPMYVVGYPRGGYKITEGKVHGIRESDKQLRLTSREFPKNREPVVVSGNSGGPVLNTEWRVIGVAVSSNKGFSSASPSSELKVLLDSANTENLSAWQKKNPILASVYAAWADKKSDSEHYEEAIKGFDKAVAIYRDANTYNKRGLAKDELGRYQEAIQDFNAMIGLIPDSAMAYYNRGSTYFRWNIAKRKSDDTGMVQDFAKVIQDYTEAIELNPDHAAAYANRGVAKVKMPDPDYAGAIQDYTDAIKRNPKDFKSYSDRGHAKLEIEDYAGAIQDYTEAIKLNPDDAAAYINRGAAKVKMPDPDYAGAIQDYTEAINLNPDDTLLMQAYLGRSAAKLALAELALAQAELALAQHEDAKFQHEDAKFQHEDAKRDTTKVYYYLGKIYARKGNYQEAIVNFNKSISAESDDVEIYYVRGNTKQKIGDYEGAIQDYTLTIKKNPDFAEAYYARGVTQLQLDKYQSAIDDLNEAITLKEPAVYAEAYKARGDAKAGLGKDTDAKTDFSIAYYHYGDEAYKRAEYQEAIKNFNRVLELIPNFALAYNYRGNVKIKLAKSKADIDELEGASQLYQEAIEDCDKAIQLNWENPFFYGNRGLAKFLRGIIRDADEAIVDYQAAIEDFTEVVKRKQDFLEQAYYLRGRTRCLLGSAKANQGNAREARKQYKLALKDFKAANKLDTDDASHYRGLGLANAALGKAEAARAAFEKAKQLRAEVEKQAN
ncbi:tetratricopeptide repeat protein, partial [Candidatus Poribacteria bacterium]|nr:tetratricopeptide repeat protein [Candidatus Poribacteria bacterium]